MWVGWCCVSDEKGVALVCTCVCTRVQMYVGLRVCVCTRVQMYVGLRVCVCELESLMRVCVCELESRVLSHTHKHIYIPIYTYIHTNSTPEVEWRVLCRRH